MVQLTTKKGHLDILFMTYIEIHNTRPVVHTATKSRFMYCPQNLSPSAPPRKNWYGMAPLGGECTLPCWIPLGSCGCCGWWSVSIGWLLLLLLSLSLDSCSSFPSAACAGHSKCTQWKTCRITPKHIAMCEVLKSYWCNTMFVQCDYGHITGDHAQALFPHAYLFQPLWHSMHTCPKG